MMRKSNRKAALVAAILGWIGCLGILSLDLVHFERWRTALSCHEARRDLEGSLESFTLDHGVAEARRLMRRSPIAIQAQLHLEGYVAGLRACPTGGIPIAWRVEPARGSEYETRCRAHAGTSHELLEQLASEKCPIFRMFLLGLLGLVVFPAGFWAAACLRSYRWSQRRHVGPLPASWVVVLNLLFAPAGFLAIGRYRHAAWQTIATVGLLASLGWRPLVFVAMNLVWTLVTLRTGRRF